MPDKNNAVCTDIPGKIQVDDRLKHIAFIMDGNRRWAKKKGMVSEMGHKYGAETFRRIVRYCGDVGIKCVTVYAFSTENWKRPPKEVEGLMKLLDKYLDECLEDFEKYNIRTKFIGDVAPLSEKLKAKIEKIERLTRNNGLLLNIALNYGSRSEIVNAVKHIIADGIPSLIAVAVSSAFTHFLRCSIEYTNLLNLSLSKFFKSILLLSVVFSENFVEMLTCQHLYYTI